MNTFLLTAQDTFQNWGDLWLSSKQGKVCYSQSRNLRCYLNHLYRFIGNVPICDIHTNDIDDILDALTERNPNTQRPASHQTLTDIRSTASKVFEKAIDYEAICKNPAPGREISKYAPTYNRRALTKEEQKLIIATHHRARIGALIMMLAGLRRGELIPLNWDDCDLNNLRIIINKSVEEKSGNRFILKPGTKTGTWGRIVDIPIDLGIEIEEARNHANSRFICCKLDGTMHTPTSWKRMWTGYINTIVRNNPNASSTGIDEITAHYLRHTYATLLYISGVDVVTASKLMRHSNIKTTIAIYTHLDEMMLTKSVDKLNDYISKTLF